nr:hypothetical protein [Eubacterium sp.]
FCLEDQILHQILEGIRTKSNMLINVSSNLKNGPTSDFLGIPLRILVSYRSGRRFVVLYKPEDKYLFQVVRMDHINSVKLFENINATTKNNVSGNVARKNNDIENNVTQTATKNKVINPNKELTQTTSKDKVNGKTEEASINPLSSDYIDEMQMVLDKKLENVWNVSFRSEYSGFSFQKVEMLLEINEKYEDYIITRIGREGKSGTLTRMSENKFLYEIIVIDANEMVPWLRTFIGRIVDIKFYLLDDDMKPLREIKRLKKHFMEDINQLFEMYQIGQDEAPKQEVPK